MLCRMDPSCLSWEGLMTENSSCLLKSSIPTAAFSSARTLTQVGDTLGFFFTHYSIDVPVKGDTIKIEQHIPEMVAIPAFPGLKLFRGILLPFAPLLLVCLLKRNIIQPCLHLPKNSNLAANIQRVKRYGQQPSIFPNVLNIMFLLLGFLL